MFQDGDRVCKPEEITKLNNSSNVLNIYSKNSYTVDINRVGKNIVNTCDRNEKDNVSVTDNNSDSDIDNISLLNDDNDNSVINYRSQVAPQAA